MTSLLVSVRSVPEALLAARGGADLIDLKEPGAGALGGLPAATIAALVQALRAHQITRPVSATIGDLPMEALSRILARVEAVAACGVDYVKVGIERDPKAFTVLDALVACGRPVVPVLVADRGLDPALLAHVCGLPFPALMADTADKRAGSLFDAAPLDELRHFLAQAREAGRLAGLAGALRAEHIPLLQTLDPDFAGFRSAVCVGERHTALCPEKLAQLAALVHGRSTEPAAA
jgi:uncharacterized protein (UPF0264 family)